jgi:hypothetical protein
MIKYAIKDIYETYSISTNTYKLYDTLLEAESMLNLINRSIQKTYPNIYNRYIITKIEVNKD